ncbi:MAG: protein-L-isoaspartate(D-aspartate) O-methyltransferase [Candidatus Thermoplasmatota archaeon]|jgi:protein-L-isoaspartate(D-aspartate) O-methyltransferase|nr:protein-L-isoaspartate(D-aspartate) O-methyltransferase [Candidatus Thermoplasmatota archaeon]
MKKKGVTRNDELVNYLMEEGVVRSRPVENAMRAVDRIHFVPERLAEDAYVDHPLQIGCGQTISAPHMVAIMAEELKAHIGQNVLEIGTGSGYHAAVVAELVGEKGHVRSMEVVPELAAFARENLARAGTRNVTVTEGDGSVGLPEMSPFDRIYYTCAAPSVPRSVLDQLGEEGIALGVVGPKYSTQRLIRFTRTDDTFKEEPLTYCIFVPLVGRLGH